MNQKNLKSTAVIDLFCGIGGLSQGFVLEKFPVIAGYDNMPSCKYAYETNNHAEFICKDITTLAGKELNEKFGDAKLKILVGCAPCQPFSSYSFRVKNKDEKKVNLLYSFAKLIKETNPDIVSMENVPQLVDFKANTIFDDFKTSLEKLGYHIHYEVVFCPQYGIPQHRKRLVLLASKLGKISLIPPICNEQDYPTVRDAIGDLPKIAAGETDENDALHRARRLSEKNLERIQHSAMGKTWREWPQELLPECYKRDSGKTYGSVYGRMSWDEPSPTMTTHCTGFGNGRFGHPEQDRAITLREAALLQSFPKKYQFFDSQAGYNSVMLCKQIGNAVPPKLGQAIAKSIKQHLQEVGYGNH
jgi:DNA (cytosine-5)-methyltransferase 1